MRRALALVLASSVLVLTGCGGGDAADAGGKDTAKSSRAEDKSTSPDEPEKPTAQDGKDHDACFDGTCQIEVDGDAELSVDPGVFGGDTMVIKVSGGTVDVTLTGDGTRVHAGMSGDGASVLNGIRIECTIVDDETAVVDMKPEN